MEVNRRNREREIVGIKTRRQRKNDRRMKGSYRERQTDKMEDRDGMRWNKRESEKERERKTGQRRLLPPFHLIILAPRDRSFVVVVATSSSECCCKNRLRAIDVTKLHPIDCPHPYIVIITLLLPPKLGVEPSPKAFICRKSIITKSKTFKFFFLFEQTTCYCITNRR